MKKLFSLLSFLLIAAGAWADYYTPSSAYTQGDAVIYATVSTNETGADAYSYEVGAFVDDVCIGNAKPMESQPIYVIRARGNEDLVGKTIEFRAYNATSKAEYALTPSQNITFQLTGTYGYPSQLVTLTLKAATNYKLADVEVEIGKSVDLREYLTMTPSDATLPLNAGWRYTSSKGAGNVTIEGNIMTGLARDWGNVYLYVGSPDRFVCYAAYQVLRRATAINIVTEVFEVDLYDRYALTNFMENISDEGKAYSLTPSDATDKVYWEMDEEFIVEFYEEEQDEEGEFYTVTYYSPEKGGTTQIRPYFINKSGTKVYPLNNQWITIKVNVPVESISFNFTEGYINANVGDDIYQRLIDHLVFNPSDATNQNVTFSTTSTDKLTISGTSAVVKAKGSGTIKVTTADGGKTANLQFYFYDPLKEVTFSQNPLSIDRETTIDEAESIIGNNIIGDPERVQEGKINVSGVISGIGEFDPDMWWMVNLTSNELEKGSATVTVTCGWYDYTTDNGGTLVWGTPKSFIVNIGVSLNGMTITVTPDTNDPTKGVITLTPDPADADINWADFPVKVDFDRDNSWNTIKLTDNGNGKTSYSAEMPGLYFVAPVGGADPKYFEVPYKSVQASGWQWCSNPYGRIDNEGNLFSKVFGDDFAEARTFNDLLINDPSWGLFGTMLNEGIRQDEMYKLKMNGAHTGFIYGGDLDDIPLEQPLSEGWNWIGSPFFFDRILIRAISTGSLVKNMVIASKSDGSAEWDGTKWVGDLTAIKKGQGYLVYLPSGSRTLAFEDEFEYDPGNDSPIVGAPHHTAFSSPWQYDHTQFADNMTMVATVEGIVDTDRYTIGAFVGDECRGEGEFIDGLAFITVHGNVGEQVTFRLHDSYMGEFFDIDQKVTSKTRLGSLDAPVRLSSQGFTDGISTVHVDNGISGETYDANGRRLNGLQRGINIIRQSDGTVRKVIKK